jgi:ribulose-phosphate 3-epimerase
MTIISPSILACNFLRLEEEIKAFDSCKNIQFHLDLMDGHYVPNLSFGKCIIKDLHTITKHNLDAHLMVTNPEDYIEPLSSIGLNNLTFHIEVTEDPNAIIDKTKKSIPSVGISLNPKTPLSKIPNDTYKKIDILLIMSVDPGFGGQSFIEATYAKVKEAVKIRNKLGANFKIQVDGGVNNLNAEKLIECGTDILVAGSYIFKANSTEYNKQVESLRS